MSKPRGSWAADVELEEQEAAAAAAAAAAAKASATSGDFPNLREAINTKPKKKKMTLTEFYTSSIGTGGLSSESKRLTPDEMLRLPTGPKERSAEEMQYGRLGGGFSNYGSGPGRVREQTDNIDGGWSRNRRQYGEGAGPPARVSDYDQPSRADEVDNWSSKKVAPIATPFGRSGGGFGASSRADEIDNWTRVKKPFLTSSGNNRSSSFGSGFGESRGGGGAESERWTRGGGDRPRLVLDPPKSEFVSNEVVKTNRSNPFGEARPREEVLAGKGVDWKKLDLEIEAKRTTTTTSSHSSRPTSAQSSRPSSAHSARSEVQGGLHQGLENLVARSKPKVNPFGDAKPREVLLQERGQDWRKIDLELEHRRVDRPETDEEKLLKEEIEHLKEAKQEESIQGPDGNQSSLKDVISQKEKELEQLIRDLDDKVRFGPRAVERPGSSRGRTASFSERPPSQSGSLDESRSLEYIDRPRSRGAQDAWSRPIDERRTFQGGRERGFPGSRDFDRSRSRERW